MDINILALQKLLNEHEKCKLDEDGVYGPETAKAVKKYLGYDTQQSTILENIKEPATEHFTLKEFYSGAYIDGVKVYKCIKPPVELYPNIQRAMDRLEDLRAELGGLPIKINSGYRTPEYNSHPKVGGAENSAHLRGSAADIVVKGVHPRDVYAAADKLYPEGGVGLYTDFVHVDLDLEVARPKRW